MKLHNDDLPWVQMVKCMYHNRPPPLSRFSVLVSRNSCSSFPIHKLANGGAIRVPMAVPCVYVVISIEGKKFMVNIKRIRWQRSAVEGTK